MISKLKQIQSFDEDRPMVSARRSLLTQAKRFQSHLTMML